jgi:hypothetical protein
MRLALRRLAVVGMVVVVAAGSPARAEVKDVALTDLVAQSDVIVVATVTEIVNGPDGIRPVEDRYPAVKVATARVVETWKGKPVRFIRFIATPTRPCDTASTEKGEQLVLFLENQDEMPMMIAHVGRGVMPLRDVEGKTYATLQSEVKLPEGTKTISEQRTGTLCLRAPPGKREKTSVSLKFTYTVYSLELATLRDLVRSRGR